MRNNKKGDETRIKIKDLLFYLFLLIVFCLMGFLAIIMIEL